MEGTPDRALESAHRKGEPIMSEMGRYSRQLLFPPIGEKGQQRLLDSRVAIVGMGALGTVLANHMVRAGIGFVRIIDRDFVEASNLQRQMLYTEQHAAEAMPKAVAAKDVLTQVNSSITIEAHVVDLHAHNAESLLSDVDLILDGTDNFTVRYLLNDVAVKHGIPWIYGGAVASRGVMLPIIPGEGPCLRCLFPHAPEPGTTETCDTSGVIGGIIHVVASYQATEALKWLVGDHDIIQRGMLQFDLWHNLHSTIDVSRARRTHCITCGERRFEYLDATAEGDTISTLCGRDSVQISPSRAVRLNLSEWAEKWKPLGKVEKTPFLLRFDTDSQHRIVLFPDGRAMIQGTSDPIVAKSLYSRYVGV
jgi:molybdopterin/thiamine biosynthesis adenylyltransferase